jgi:hypothetical protein
MSLVLNYRHQPYTITVSALNMLAHIVNPDTLDASDIPVVRLLSHDNAAVRGTMVRVISRLASVFTADTDTASQLVEALAAHQRWYARAAVISAMTALVKAAAVDSLQLERVVHILLNTFNQPERRNLYEVHTNQLQSIESVSQ